ncbi:MAG: hypothetical protein ACLP7P_02355 [Rhodomicrobium sp.]
MSDQPPAKATFAAFLGTARGKLITTLTVIALLLGIAAEGVSLVTGVYNMQKVRADRDISEIAAIARTSRPTTDSYPRAEPAESAPSELMKAIHTTCYENKADDSTAAKKCLVDNIKALMAARRSGSPFIFRP